MRRSVLFALLLVTCQPASATPAPARSALPPPASPFAPPAVAVRVPADAVLDDATVGLPRTSARDHLGAAEAARDQPDQVLALNAFSGFLWQDASTRRWAGGARAVVELVLLSFSNSGSSLAYAYWEPDASRAPLAAGACPAEVAGLDRCVLGSGAGRSVVVGMVGRVIFRLEGDTADVTRLAPLQAARIRS